MLSPALHAAALAHARRLTNDHSEASLLPLADAYEVGYAAGYTAPRSARFPLAGDQAFKRLLGAYLAENITVYHPHSGRYGLLRGLPACYSHDGQPFAEVEFYADAEAQAEGCGDLLQDVNTLLPVLYGFEELATELTLADGRRVVPAIEMVKEDMPDLAATATGWRAEIQQVGLLRLLRVYSDTGYHMCIQDGGLTYGEVTERTAKLLREWHFAVGLSPDQYHRRQPGFDYASGAKPGCAACQGCEKGKEVGRG